MYTYESEFQKVRTRRGFRSNNISHHTTRTVGQQKELILSERFKLLREDSNSKSAVSGKGRRQLTRTPASGANTTLLGRNKLIGPPGSRPRNDNPSMKRNHHTVNNVRDKSTGVGSMTKMRTKPHAADKYSTNTSKNDVRKWINVLFKPLSDRKKEKVPNIIINITKKGERSVRNVEQHGAKKVNDRAVSKPPKAKNQDDDQQPQKGKERGEEIRLRKKEKKKRKAREKKERVKSAKRKTTENSAPRVASRQTEMSRGKRKREVENVSSSQYEESSCPERSSKKTRSDTVSDSTCFANSVKKSIAKFQLILQKRKPMSNSSEDIPGTPLQRRLYSHVVLSPEEREGQEPDPHLPGAASGSNWDRKEKTGGEKSNTPSDSSCEMCGQIFSNDYDLESHVEIFHGYFVKLRASEQLTLPTNVARAIRYAGPTFCFSEDPKENASKWEEMASKWSPDDGPRKQEDDEEADSEESQNLLDRAGSEHSLHCGMGTQGDIITGVDGTGTGDTMEGALMDVKQEASTQMSEVAQKYNEYLSKVKEGNHPAEDCEAMKIVYNAANGGTGMTHYIIANALEAGDPTFYNMLSEEDKVQYAGNEHGILSKSREVEWDTQSSGIEAAAIADALEKQNKEEEKIMEEERGMDEAAAEVEDAFYGRGTDPLAGSPKGPKKDGEKLLQDTPPQTDDPEPSGSGEQTEAEEKSPGVPVTGKKRARKAGSSSTNDSSPEKPILKKVRSARGRGIAVSTRIRGGRGRGGSRGALTVGGGAGRGRGQGPTTPTLRKARSQPKKGEETPGCPVETRRTTRASAAKAKTEKGKKPTSKNIKGGKIDPSGSDPSKKPDELRTGAANAAAGVNKRVDKEEPEMAPQRVRWREGLYAELRYPMDQEGEERARELDEQLRQYASTYGVVPGQEEDDPPRPTSFHTEVPNHAGQEMPPEYAHVPIQTKSLSTSGFARRRAGVGISTGACANPRPTKKDPPPPPPPTTSKPPQNRMEHGKDGASSEDSILEVTVSPKSGPPSTVDVSDSSSARSERSLESLVSQVVAGSGPVPGNSKGSSYESGKAAGDQSLYLKQQVSALMQENTRMANNMSEAKGNIKAQTAKITSLMSDLADTRNQLESAVLDKESLLAEHTANIKRLDKAKKESNERRLEKEEINSKLTTLQNRHNRLKAEKSMLDKKLDELSATVANQERFLKTTRVNADKWVKYMAERENSPTAGTNASRAQALQQALDEVQRLNDQINVMDSQIRAQTEMIQDLQDAAEAGPSGPSTSEVGGRSEETQEALGEARGEIKELKKKIKHMEKVESNRLARYLEEASKADPDVQRLQALHMDQIESLTEQSLRYKSERDDQRRLNARLQGTQQFKITSVLQQNNIANGDNADAAKEVEKLMLEKARLHSILDHDQEIIETLKREKADGANRLAALQKTIPCKFPDCTGTIFGDDNRERSCPYGGHTGQNIKDRLGKTRVSASEMFTMEDGISPPTGIKKVSLADTRTVCEHWASKDGVCREGDSCRFPHPGPDGEDMRKKKKMVIKPAQIVPQQYQGGARADAESSDDDSVFDNDEEEALPASTRTVRVVSEEEVQMRKKAEKKRGREPESDSESESESADEDTERPKHKIRSKAKKYRKYEGSDEMESENSREASAVDRKSPTSADQVAEPKRQPRTARRKDVHVHVTGQESRRLQSRVVKAYRSSSTKEKTKEGSRTNTRDSSEPLRKSRSPAKDRYHSRSRSSSQQQRRPSTKSSSSETGRHRHRTVSQSSRTSRSSDSSPARRSVTWKTRGSSRLRTTRSRSSPPPRLSPVPEDKRKESFSRRDRRLSQDRRGRGEQERRGPGDRRESSGEERRGRRGEERRGSSAERRGGNYWGKGRN